MYRFYAATSGCKLEEFEQDKKAEQDLRHEVFRLDEWRGEPRLIVFFIPLSTPLGLVHDSTYAFLRVETVDWMRGAEIRLSPDIPPLPLGEIGEEGKNLVSLKVWLPKETPSMPTAIMESVMRVVQEVTGGSLGNKAPDQTQGGAIRATFESYSTIIEAVTPLLEVPDRRSDPILAAFDRCLEELALLTRAYTLASGDLRVRLPARQNLFPFVPFTTRHPSKKDWSSLQLLLLNRGYSLSSPTESLSEDQLADFDLYLELLKRRNPFLTFSEWARAARQAFYVDGDYATTVINAHIAGEVLFDTTLLMMAWEEETPREEAANWFESALAKRLRTYYAPRLGGAWDTRMPKTVSGRWTMRVSDVRNRLVHSGYRPTELEALTALDLFDEVVEFVKGRLVVQRDKYPRTTLMLLGQPGLERREAYKGKIKNFVENRAGREEAWIESYLQWFESSGGSVSQ